MEKLSKTLAGVRSRGVLYSIGVVTNRIVPSKLFRFRIFRVYELALNQTAMEVEDDVKDTAAIVIQKCESDLDFQTAHLVTRIPAQSVQIADSKLRHSAWIARLKDQVGAQTNNEVIGEVVGGVWTASGWFEEQDLKIRIQLSGEDKWVFSAYVDHSHRRKGVYAKLLDQLLRKETQLDSNKVFAAINPTNRASLTAHRKYICETKGTCIAVRVLGVSFCFATGQISVDRFCSIGSRSKSLELSWKQI